MAEIWELILKFWNIILEKLSEFFNVLMFIGPLDVLDILLVCFVIYKAIQLIRETRAEQLFKGLLALLVIFIISRWLDLLSLKYLLDKALGQLVLVAAIIFQPEIRKLLERVGTANISGNLMGHTDEDAAKGTITAVCASSRVLSESNTGALIVFERKTLLNEIVSTGTVLNADTTQSLICNVFSPNTPLHDGAMIIRAGRVYAAGCILPLTEKEISRELGTRHRAALGMSEYSDSIVVVVSEETGVISLAINGEMERGLEPVHLQQKLENVLLEGQESAVSGARSFWKKIFRRGEKQ